MLVETTGGAKYTAADSQRMLKDLNLTQQVPSPVGCLIFCADLSITCKAMLACGYVHCMTVILAKLSSFVQHGQAALLDHRDAFLVNEKFIHASAVAC